LSKGWATTEHSGCSRPAGAAGASKAPDPVKLGSELRDIAYRIEFASAHVIVCDLALDGQGSEHDKEIAWVLKRTVCDGLYNQIRRLQLLAHRVDGLPPSLEEDLDDADFEGINDDRGEGAEWTLTPNVDVGTTSQR
jgi:hypothetical protein